MPPLVKVKVLFAQSRLTLWDPMDYSPPGSCVQGILQARILEWVAISYSRGSSAGMEPGSPALQADSLPSEPPGYWKHELSPCASGVYPEFCSSLCSEAFSVPLHAFVIWGKPFNVILVWSEKKKRERELRFQVLRPLYKTSVTLPDSKWGNVGSEKLSNSRACGETSSDDCGPPWCQSPSLGRECVSPHSWREELLGDTGDAGALPVVDGKLSLGNSLKAKVSIPQMWCYDF